MVDPVVVSGLTWSLLWLPLTFGITAGFGLAGSRVGVVLTLALGGALCF